MISGTLTRRFPGILGCDEQIEIARKFPSARMLQKLADALKVKPYKLFICENDIEDFDVSDILNFLSKNLKGQIDKDIDNLSEKLSAQRK